MKYYISFIAAGIFSLLITGATFARVAEISINVQPAVVRIHDVSQIIVSLSTDDQAANAIEGILNLPKGVSLREIRDGNSIVPLWIEAPHEIASGSIAFSGIIPGGYVGDHGFLFTAYVVPTAVGSEQITLEGVRVLANSGDGKEIPISLPSSVLTTTLDAPTSTVDSVDRNPPEDFLPSIEHNGSLLEDSYFLVFATTDKGVGIDHYEVMEVLDGSGDENLNTWHQATSPYLLNDQDLRSTIYVRAVDRSGNFRIVTIPKDSESVLSVKSSWISIIIVLGVILLLIYVARRIYRRFMHEPL